MIPLERVRSGGHRRLVVVRAGHTSLHRQWFTPGAPRRFDLLVFAYQGDRADHGDELDLHAFAPGKKLRAIAALLADHPELYADYDSFWLADDDLATCAADIDRMFDSFAALDAGLAQPALTADSFVAHAVTARNQSTRHRRTNFVEIMCPLLRAATLRGLAPLFDLTESGWGVDIVWSDMHVRQDLPMYILDEVAVRHTRPVFAGDAYRGLASHPWAECAKILHALGITDRDYRDLVHHLRDGRVIDLRRPG